MSECHTLSPKGWEIHLKLTYLPQAVRSSQTARLLPSWAGGSSNNNNILIIHSYHIVRSRDTSVGIATARVSFPTVQHFSLLYVVQTGSGAHSASYPMGTGVKAAGVLS
jgi:hypothetical protein